MADQPENYQFNSPDELLKYLKEKSDDIDRLTVPVKADILFTGPEGQQIVDRNVGAILNLCDGRSIVIAPETANALLNDGILNRLGIEIKLDNRVDPSSGN